MSASFKPRSSGHQGSVAHAARLVHMNCIMYPALHFDTALRYLRRRANPAGRMCRSSFDRRQLRHPQASEGANLAGAAGPISDPLHADLLVVVEPGGAVVCTDHPACDSARLISKRQGIGRQDRLFRPALQPLAAPFRLDRNGRLHSRQNRPPLFTYFRDTTLE